MTILKYSIIVLYFCTSLIGIANGQKNVKSSIENESPKSLKFIEGIELKRNEVHSSSNSVVINQSNSLFIPISSIEEATSYTESVNSRQIKYAQLLNVEIESVKNLTLFNFIEEWWKTRYLFGGNSKSGIDCSAFSGLLERTVYGNNLPRMARDQYSVCDKIPFEEINQGDLVFFNTRGGVSHVGVYLANGYFVHASCNNGVFISSLNEGYYHKRFISAGRIKKQ